MLPFGRFRLGTVGRRGKLTFPSLFLYFENPQAKPPSHLNSYSTHIHINIEKSPFQNDIFIE